MEKENRLATIQLTGNRRAVVEGCDGVVDYGEEQVLVRLGRRVVTLTGRRLRLVRLTEDSAVVEGVLERVDFGE